ncbi:hypothetical protein D3C85_13710 [compost metagenome]
MSNNVVTAVVDLLAKDNPSAANRFARNFHCNSGEAGAQVCELNRYWRDQLSALHVSTISARTCLVDNIEPNDWLRHFRQLVLPTIVKYDLPTVH